ncbi:MAG: ParB/RepB/Spo0J family partition protein [Candidatus Neomarinimicrobiota bacterium]
MTADRLGKGLGALIGRTFEETAGPESTLLVPIDRITPNPFQPRQDFESPGANRSLEELANSIREKGIIQPITVRSKGDGYELIVGERRWRAAKLAGLEEIAALILEIDSDVEMMEYALIENLQRENLNAIEEAEAYATLKKKYTLSHAEIARAVGKSRVAVSNTLRLLNLPERIKESLKREEITAGHARALLGLKNTRDMVRLWKRIVERDESVRATEELVANAMAGEKKAMRRSHLLSVPKSVEIRKVENDLIAILGTKVTIRERSKGGVIEVEYYSQDDLQRLLELFADMEAEEF